MSQLKYMKMWVTVWASISKETILSKLINMVHVFRVNVAHKPFDDVQKKYIDTILKIDDSKTIILETKWEEVSIRNIPAISYSVWQTITIEYSQIHEDDESILFVNYAFLPQMPRGTQLAFEGSSIILEVTDNDDDKATCKVITAGTTSLGQKVTFAWYVPKLSFLSDKDKKDVIRGIHSGVNLLAASAVKTADDIVDMKRFLDSQEAHGIKVYARLHRPEAYDQIDAIIHAADGILIGSGDIAWMGSKMDEITLIQRIKSLGKPVMVCLHAALMEDTDVLRRLMHVYAAAWVDMIMVEEDITEVKAPLDPLSMIINFLIEWEQQWTQAISWYDLSYVYNNEVDESSYLVSLLPRIIADTGARVAICYTAGGLTSARIASLKLNIPVIVFTRNDFIYRYNNLLRGIKGYKIWQTSTYSELKQIGKEMIRIHFKGNISLDDKVIIINAIETDVDQSIDGIINGIELYKFKSI